MFETLLTGTGGVEIAVTALRVATGTFFAFSGYHKLFNADRHATLVATLEKCGVPFIGFNQWFVPAVEFAGGLALAVGLFTPLAAAGLLTICLVATITDGIGRIATWAPVDAADYADDVLYLPEVIYAIILAFFIAHGAGPVSYDALFAGVFF